MFANEVFMFVQDSCKGSQVEEVPDGLYICICSADFFKEAEHVQRLLEAFDRMGYEIRGDYLCEVISNHPIVEADKRFLFYKIQIPIK